MENMRPGYRCQPCHKFWDRSGNPKCACGLPGQKIIYDDAGEVQVILKTENAPLRLVVAEQPGDRSFGMLECGHTYTDPDRRTSLLEIGSAACVDCWKEDSTKKRRGIPDRNRMMVGVVG